jgi:hypothetical protein
MRTVTIVLPEGYASAEEFARDCGFQLATVAVPPPTDDQVKYLRDIQDSTGKYDPGAMVVGPNKQHR